MAHFARINEENKVEQVLVVHNEVIASNGEELEELGVQFLKNLTGHSNWKQCSFNSNFRGCFPGIGDSWDESINEFVKPEPEATDGND